MFFDAQQSFFNMDSRALLLNIALFCACVIGGCRGEEEQSSRLSRPTTTRRLHYPRFDRAGHNSYPSSYPYLYPPGGLSGSRRHNNTHPSPSGNSYYPTRDPTNSSSSEEDTTTWLREQQFITRTGLSVDINLPRIAHTEKCTLITPDNTHVRVEDSNMVGVTRYCSSDYVSCRVVVGPMEESLIGKWVLCGSYTEDNVEHRRCQSANIAWKNSTYPDTMWQTTIQPTFDHVVNFHGMLSPSVSGLGNVVSCHLVTPHNEDLFVARESEYPNIRLVQDTDSVCSIAIGPIAERHLGSWTIYGTFNSTFGYNEVRLPMNLDLYNKNHPYDQAYNITNLNPIEHVVNIGSTIAVEVASTGVVDVCLFTMPSGMFYNTIDHHANAMPSGVSFINDNRVACQLFIGPITPYMIGPWFLHGKFSNSGIFTEIRQSFTIIQGDTAPTALMSVTSKTETYQERYSPQDARDYDIWREEAKERSSTLDFPLNGINWRHLNMTTSTYTPTADGSTLRAKPQSDRVVVEMPGSLAADPDLHFALSLVPMLRRRTLRDKLDAQQDILSYFKNKLTRDEK